MVSDVASSTIPPRLNGDALSSLYERNYYVFQERHGGRIKARRPTFITLQFVSCCVGCQFKPSEALEVGSANGYLLGVCYAREGWRVRGG